MVVMDSSKVQTVGGDPMEGAMSGEVEVQTDSLWKRGVLVQIQGGVWSMEARLRPDDLDMSATQIPPFATLGKKRLLDPKFKNEFLRPIQNARSAAERLGFNFVLTGTYFVPFGNFDRLKEAIEPQQVAFYGMADRFIDAYTEKREEYLEKYSQYWDKLEPYYPNPESVRSLFKFNVLYYVASISDMVSSDGNAEDLYLQWAVDSMNTLRSEAREVAEAVKNAVDDGTLNGRTMRRVQTLIDRLQNMDMLDDTALRGAALALAADATPQTAQALKEAAKDVGVGSVRAIFLR